MPLYEIERNHSERMEPDAPGVREVEEINADEGVRWVFSFLAADKLKSYCLYEASSPDALLAPAPRARARPPRRTPPPHPPAGPSGRFDRRSRSDRGRDVRLSGGRSGSRSPLLPEGRVARHPARRAPGGQTRA